MLQAMNEINSLVLDPQWFDAPAPRTAEFFPVFALVSRTLQSTLREAIPMRYFQDVSRFENIEYAYPVLMYAATRPFRPEPAKGFSHDIMSSAAMDRLFRLAIGRMRRILIRVSHILQAHGMDKLAEEYHPRRARRIIRMCRTQKRFYRPLRNMLVVEAAMLHALIELRDTRSYTPGARARKIARFAKTWNSLLRRFYGKNDFTAAGPMVLQAVTAALIKGRALYCAEETAAKAA